MPRERRGQQISFSIEHDEDQSIPKWMWVDVRVGDTCAKIAARRGHPEEASAIRDKNDLRSARAVLRHKPKRKHDRTRLKVPGELRAANTLNVLAGDNPPTVTAGYAKLSIVDRPERTGITKFDGYDPITLDVPIRFEAVDNNGVDVERDIALLERMAGRGNFEGASTGPPPVIRIAATGPSGEIVPLIPSNYQWAPQNKNGPLWRVAGIAWDETAGSGVRRNAAGNRIRQLATVTLQQHTTLNLLSRSATTRAATRPKAKK
jgi:hypothetical protein